MNLKLLSASAALLLASFAAQASDTVTDPSRPHALPANGPVSVHWSDPAQFSDLKYSGNRWQAERGDWVEQLAAYVRKSAGKRLQPGETLDVAITDIMRAGQYEPWRGANMDTVRILRDRYPPRIEFDYALRGANGELIAQGHQKLRDTAYMLSSPPLSDSDPLRYEKRMIDDWTRRKMRDDNAIASK